MNQTNTNTQAGQDLQNLQPQGNQAQGATGSFQAGSGVNLSNPNTSNLLNERTGSRSLSVSVAGTSQTAVAPPQPVSINSSEVPAYYIIVPLVLFFFVVLLIYMRALKGNKFLIQELTENDELPAQIPKTGKTKKKRKKPKRPHHH